MQRDVKNKEQDYIIELLNSDLEDSQIVSTLKNKYLHNN